MKCIIRGMSFFQGDDGRGKFTTLATGEIEFPELQLVVRGARLTYSKERGFLAYPPNLKHRGGDALIAWRHGHEMADSARDAMLEMYGRMGGQKPEAAANNAAAKKRIAERKQDKPMPVRTVGEIDAALQRVDEHLAERGGTLMDAMADVYEQPGITELGLSRPETAGLARTLGVA